MYGMSKDLLTVNSLLCDWASVLFQHVKSSHRLNQPLPQQRPTEQDCRRRGHGYLLHPNVAINCLNVLLTGVCLKCCKFVSVGSLVISCFVLTVAVARWLRMNVG